MSEKLAVLSFLMLQKEKPESGLNVGSLTVYLRLRIVRMSCTINHDIQINSGVRATKTRNSPAIEPKRTQKCHPCFHRHRIWLCYNRPWITRALPPLPRFVELTIPIHHCYNEMKPYGSSWNKSEKYSFFNNWRDIQLLRCTRISCYNFDHHVIVKSKKNNFIHKIERITWHALITGMHHVQQYQRDGRRLCLRGLEFFDVQCRQNVIPTV